MYKINNPCDKIHNIYMELSIIIIIITNYIHMLLLIIFLQIDIISLYAICLKLFACSDIIVMSKHQRFGSIEIMCHYFVIFTHGCK